MAMGSQSIASGQLTVHSDRGTPYASKEFRETMKLYGILHGIKTVILRFENYWDQSAAETFFASLKKEKAYRKK